MSERVLGVVEREALDRARARLVALRAEQFRLLGDIAELERLGVAEQTGDRSSIRFAARSAAMWISPRRSGWWVRPRT